jgi:hypothetical protein
VQIITYLITQINAKVQNLPMGPAVACVGKNREDSQLARLSDISRVQYCIGGQHCQQRAITRLWAHTCGVKWFSVDENRFFV